MVIDAQTKDDIFRNPTIDNLHFGRYIATIQFKDMILTAIQEGVQKSTRMLLFSQRNGNRKFIESPLGLVHQPVLAVSKQGTVAAVWNEATAEGWEIRTAIVNLEKTSLDQIETVCTSQTLCLAPTVAFVGEKLYIAWSGLDSGQFQIHVSSKMDSEWIMDRDLAVPGVDCFRPQLAAMRGKLLCIWDQYQQPTYNIALREYDGEKWRSITIPQAAHERWFYPRIVANESYAWITWLVVTDVIDDLGIIDHDVFAPVACYDGREVKFLEDQSNHTDSRVVADLREGLLAGEIYKGHVGLRRNPQLTIGTDGALWCFWESRKESPDSAVVGRLVGRRFHEGQWGQPMAFCDDGYCWSVANYVDDDQVAVSFLKFDETGRDVLRSRKISLQSGQSLQIDTTKWNRWKKVNLSPPTKPVKTIESDGEIYSLFWADTHVHSVLSPDAEGEVDELIHFARDVAGLDVICIIDNDYYPHKALTEPEWRIHQEFAKHFTMPGEFVCFPGYEFTYHRSDLDPDFNHRCVIYPRQGPLLRRIDPQSNTDKKLIAHLKKIDAMAYPHHCSYKLIDTEMGWNIEVCSSWRVCLEETDFTIRQLKNGVKIGFVGSSDTHRMSPGLAGARSGLWATDLTPEALFDSYRNHRCLATQGQNILIDFRINDKLIGSSLKTTTAPKIRAFVDAPVEIEWVEVIRNGESVFRSAPADKAALVEWNDEQLPIGNYFYFLRVKLVGDPSFNIEGGNPSTNSIKPFSQNSRYPHNLARAQGPFAWSSPIWITMS